MPQDAMFLPNTQTYGVHGGPRHCNTSVHSSTQHFIALSRFEYSSSIAPPGPPPRFDLQGGNSTQQNISRLIAPPVLQGATQLSRIYRAQSPLQDHSSNSPHMGQLNRPHVRLCPPALLTTPLEHICSRTASSILNQKIYLVIVSYSTGSIPCDLTRLWPRD